MINPLQSFVIHKKWSGETSAQVSFFTQEAGLIQGLCRGGRTPKKQAHLQLFTPLWLYLNERYHRYYVQSIESLHPTFDLAGHALFAGFYMNELLYHSLSPLEPEPELFKAYAHTLQAMADGASQGQALESLLRRFEWSLLKTLGYSFSLTQEAYCNTPILEEKYYGFIPTEGFVLQSQGILGSHILALSTDNLTNTEYLQTAKKIMRQAIDNLLGGREIKARALYKDLTQRSNYDK